MDRMIAPAAENPKPFVLPAIAEVGRHVSYQRLTALLLVATMFACCALAFVPWQQNVAGVGKMIAWSPTERQQTIDAPVDGRLVRWFVVEGSRVRKGDPVAEMADLDPTLPARLQMERAAALERIRAISDREDHLEQRVEQLEQSVKNEIAAADFRIQQARDRVRASEQSIEVATAKQTVSAQNLERHRTLLPKGLVSRRQLEVAEAEKNTADAELRRARAQLDEAENFLRAVEVDRARTINSGTAIIRDARASRESALGELASARQALQPVEVRLNRQSTQTIYAPVDGVIFRLDVQPGSAVVKTGDGIASIVPEVTQPVAELWIDGNDLPLVRQGSKVRLQFEGWPAIQFVGWPSVAVGTFGGVVKLVDSTDDGKGKFRVLVEQDPQDEPWPQSRYLRQGVKAKGWVLLNTVRLGFEVWRQFNGFPQAADYEPVPAKVKKVVK
jgi:multidrug resistance efflux pump